MEYEGQVYNTIQIFSQCWLKENLNVGEMIPGTIEQSDNGTIEKYCYDNDINNCANYGGLYQWREMMQYITWFRIISFEHPKIYRYDAGIKELGFSVRCLRD